MAVYYFDSSALVKNYVQETGTAWVQSLLDPVGQNTIIVLRISHVEVMAALSRRFREGSLTLSQAQAVKSKFESDIAHEFVIIEVAPVLLTSAAGLADTYGLRAYDAVHLAAALELDMRRTAATLPRLRLVSADTDLNTAANTAGLLVENPNEHP